MLLILLLFANIQYAWLLPSYTILAPKIIRPFSEFNILIGVENLPSKTTITATLSKTNGNKQESTIQSLDLQANTIYFEKLKINIGTDWTEGSYNLTIAAQGGIGFAQSYPIEYIYKRYIIMVQTDKAIYRPGDDVNFRVLVLNDELKPVQIREIDDMSIFIIDPGNFKLRQLLLNYGSVKLDKDIPSVNKFNYSDIGVTEDIKFNIPEEAQTGPWMLQTVTKGQIQNYTFFVDYYSPALANVTIDIPQTIKYGKLINFTISTFYTFGKPVQGQLDVDISKISECGRKFNETTPWLNSTKMNGQEHFQIDMVEAFLHFSSNNCTEMSFNLSVKVTDDNTKSIYYNYQTFEIINGDIKAKIGDDKTKYRPGKVVQKKIDLNKVTGEPVSDEEMKSLTCIANVFTNVSSQPIPREASKIYRKDGSIYCDFPTDDTFVNMEISVVNEYQDHLIHEIVNFDRGCIKDNIQVSKQQQDTLQTDTQAKFSLISTQPIKDVIYFIVIRGSITKSEKVTFDNELTSQTLNIDITKDMVPEATIVVYVKTKDTNVILSDSLSFEVQGEFHNEVTFNVTKPMVDAGEEARFTVKSEPDSKVFLLGTDVGLLAVKQGNDITSKRILDELTEINKYKNEIDGFDQSGMNLLTNGKRECPIEHRLFDMTIDRGDDNDCDDDNCDRDKNKIRKDFRETWIWDSFDMLENKKLGIKSKVPDSITSWKLTGFSINSEKGLGLTNIPGYVTVFRNFFVKLSLPNIIKRNETSDMHLMIFNYLDTSIKVDITFNQDDSSLRPLTFKNCNQKTTLKPNEIKTMTCKVSSDSVGRFNITAQAKATTLVGGKEYSDGEERILNVIYEGFTQRQAKTVLFDLTKIEQDSIDQTITIEFPTDHIKGTETVLFSATSELITVDYRDKIGQIREKFNYVHYDFSPPDGCCQQRMLSFFNKVFWIQYMEATERATPAIIDQATYIVQYGIERLCPHNPPDGSYVYYGWGDGSLGNIVPGSARSFLWQTAYTLKMFIVSRNVTKVRIDEGTIVQTMNWIKRQQVATGEYIETAPEYTFFRTNNLLPNAYLTAFVRAIMYESGELVNDPADKWMGEIFPKLTNPLDIIVTCYALHVVKSKDMHTCFDKVEAMMQKDSAFGNYWKDQDNSPNLMITAYGLMILSMRKDIGTGMEVFKFMVSRQAPDGNFHDDEQYLHGMENLGTIISTEAMTKFILLLDKYKFEEENMQITFEQHPGNGIMMRLKKDDQVLHIEEGDSKVDKVKITGKGFGRAKATVYLQYNTWNVQDGKFNISVSEKRPLDEISELNICTSYNNMDTINNGIVEIEMPTGYKFNKDLFRNDLAGIDRIESKDDDTLIILYLKEIPKHALCFDIPVIESYSVDDRHPCSVKVYPFYNRGAMSVHTYFPK